MGKIVAVSVSAIVVIVAVLAVTKIGHVIDAATQHFMLYYAGVLALVGLTGSVLLGLVATDRIVMTPGHRVMAQAVHRAFSFGTLAFLIIHITTEILAQRSHVLDAVVPFLSPYRTFYIGLGTIASDLILLLVITSILRKRFTAHGKAWRWRAMHYSSYVAFVFGVLHGLLGGRAAKPYVDWSYGFAIAVTAFGLAVRFLAVSLRPKESLSTSPSVDRPGSGSASPMRAAAMAMAQAQLSGAQFGSTVQQVLPAALGAGRVADTGSWTATALPVQGRSPASGPLAAIGPAPDYGADYGAVPDYGTASVYGAVPAYVGAPPVMGAYGALPDPYSPAPDPYRELGFTPLGAPPYGDDPQNGMRARPYVTAEPSRPAVGGPARQPRYEPGYDGPPRFEGAPRGHGDVPQDTSSSYPYGSPGHRAKPISPYPEAYQDRGAPGGYTTPWPGPTEPARPRAAIAGPSRPGERNSGPQPQFGSGPIPRPDTGPMPRIDAGPMPRPDTGPIPRVDSGPMPRIDSGPMPRPDTGSFPRVGSAQPPRHGTGPMLRAGTGPMPRADSGPPPPPRPGTGPMPRPDTGPMPRIDAGPMPRPGTGPMPRVGSGPGARSNTGPMPRPDTGPVPRVDSGPMPRIDSGPMPRPDTGSFPRVGGGQPPRNGAGPAPRTGRRGTPGIDTGSMPRLGTGPMPRPDTGPMPRPDTGPRPVTGSTRSGPRHGRPVNEPATGSRTGSQPRPATRPSHRAKPTDPRYRDIPGPTGGGEWE